MRLPYPLSFHRLNRSRYTCLVIETHQETAEAGDQLRFRDIDVQAVSDVQALVDWANDPSIRHLFLRFADQAAVARTQQFSTMQKSLRKSLSDQRRLRIIEYQGMIVGEVSFDLASEALHRASPNTAFMGLVLGSKDARGRGIGRKAMLHIEALAASLGASHSQLGVFEFNERAHKLYASLGYQEVARIPNFTWWQGKTWTDIRMSKPL